MGKRKRNAAKWVASDAITCFSLSASIPSVHLLSAILISSFSFSFRKRWLCFDHFKLGETDTHSHYFIYERHLVLNGDFEANIGSVRFDNKK